MPDSFYIGYQPKAPRRTARWILLSCVVLLLGFWAWAWSWLPLNADAGDGAYEFGILSQWQGVIQDDAYPVVRIADEDGTAREALLVSQYKHGADPVTQVHQGQTVRISGSRIERGGMLMIELAAEGAIEVLPAPPAPPDSSQVEMTAAGAPTSPVSIIGEIMDSKCWLGVMSPGEGRLHRACARLCVRGGIPPVFVFNDEAGDRRIALLYGPDGQYASERVYPLVATEIALTGTLSEGHDGQLDRFMLASWPQ